MHWQKETLIDSMNFKQVSKKLQSVYHLDSEPVAVNYSNQPSPGGNNQKRFVCVALQQARRGAIINLCAENISCPGGMHWLGLKNQSEFLFPYLTKVERFFKDLAIAKEWFDTVPTPPWGRGKFVILKPLVLAQEEPDLVFFVVNTHQAHRIQTTLIYNDGSLVLQNFFAATCQSAIGIPIVTQKPYVSLPDTASRKFAKFTDSNVIVSLPYHHMVNLLANIDKSGGATLE